MKTSNAHQLATNIRPGQVYRRSELQHCTTAVDRDLSTLISNGVIRKAGPGLYYKPKQTPFGELPPDDKNLVKAFLREDQFLLYSWNAYNSLGVGLTQLYNQMVVYNYKRHGNFTLGGKRFLFRRPPRGFPKTLSTEFLLVDLVNNLNELAEDKDTVKLNIINQLGEFNVTELGRLAKQYGKVGTQRFFEEALRHGSKLSTQLT